MKRKETYLSRDLRETVALRFPAQAKQLNAAFDILHTQNSACVCEISVIFLVFRYTLGLPQAPGLAGGGLTMYKQAEAEQNNAKPRDCG